MSEQQSLILNVNVLDVGSATRAWTQDPKAPWGFIDPEHYVQAARIAERGTLDALFLADVPALREDPSLQPARGLEPTTVLAAAAAATERIGLIGTLSTSFNDPVELAVRLLSLDHASGGRAAWNVVTTYSPAAAANFGLGQLPDRERRYRRAHEFVDVVLGLWESACTGKPFTHRGELFTVDTTLRVPPSAQGYPALVQAGGSPEGCDLAGRTAHAVFSAELTLTKAVEHYRYLKQIAQAAGREPRSIKILPGLTTTIGSTEREAISRYAALTLDGEDAATARRLESALGVDLRELDLDRPLPTAILKAESDLQSFAGSVGFRESVVGLARERTNLTVRGLLREMHGGGHRAVIGTPEQVADTIEEWFRCGAADGFNIRPDAVPSGLTTFVEEVVPILRRRGLFRHEYAESTYRERLESPLRLAA